VRDAGVSLSKKLSGSIVEVLPSGILGFLQIRCGVPVAITENS
jgi:hypothetical protein